MGQPFPSHRLIEAFQAYSWRDVLLRVSLLAAVLANKSADDAGPGAEQIVRAPLEAYRNNVNPIWARIAEYVHDNPRRPVAHEQVIYLLAAMAILYGRDEGPEPAPEHFAVLFLAANDYLSNWAEDDSRTLTRDEELTAELVHVARFNTYSDALRDLVRVNLMFSRTPPQGPLSARDVWSQIQTEAFGSSFDEFFHTFIMPLHFEMQRWGSQDGDRWVTPVIEPARRYASTAVDPAAGKAFLDALTTTREAAKAQIQVTVAGIPHAPTLFIRKPFVRVDAERVVAVSPWSVREQLKGGLYTSFSRVVNAHYDKEVWPSAFGHLFELHCRYIAEIASNSSAFRGQLILSEAPGSPDEIEDVVILEGSGCVLGSAKSRLVTEQVARQARSRTALLDWYDEFLFGDEKGRYQAGALRLLDRKVRDIRAGRYSQIAADTVIAPMLITFDDLADNPMLARRIAKCCRDRNVLRQPNVLPVVLAPVDEYEVLMSLAARGRSVLELLSRFTADREGQPNLNGFLHAVRGGEKVRLAELDEAFHRITDETKRHLFPKPPQAG